MDLVIAEKPSVARDLARILGVRGRGGDGDWLENEQYAITWCVGHLVELDEPASYNEAWKAWRLDRLPMLPEEFRLRPSQHAKGQLRTVARLLKDKRFRGVINACDAGREGELIFRYVYQYARSKLPVQRLWISSLTDDAIRRGFASLRPGRDYDALAAAAYSRSEADWLVGMNATRAVTTRNRRPSAEANNTLFSIGRVQTPTLALLVRREDEIRTFVPRSYWEVHGDFRTTDGATFQAVWRHGKQPRLAAAELADAVVARDTADAAGSRVVDVTAKTVREPAPQLFDLTSLQRTANRRFGFSAARTLELAQALYERHKVVTYPRTDSRHLSADVAKGLPALFGAFASFEPYAPFARTLVEKLPRPSSRIVDDSKVSDHHAIIPTGTLPRNLDRDEARLFDLIVRRFLGAFFPDAEIAVTEAWIRVGPGEGPPPPHAAPDRERFVEALPPPPDHFLARGRVRLVAGWQDVVGISERKDSGTDRDRDRDDEPRGALPPLAVGQRLAGAFKAVPRQTPPPPRHTEATLLATMESAGKTIDDEALRAAMKDVGLGTPATRAAIIETLLRRRYIVRDKQHLVPTEMGIGLIRALIATKVGTLASPELTGSWEARLARVARGEESRAAFMADIATYVREVIEAIRGAGDDTLPPIPSMPPGDQGGGGARKGRGSRGAPRAKRPRAASAGGAQAKRAPSGVRRTTATSPSSAPRSVATASTGASRAKPADKLVVTCPTCGQGTVIAGNRGWGCSRWREGCRFVIWFERAARDLSPSALADAIAQL